MKKFLISISGLCIVWLIIMWILCGPKGVVVLVACFGAVIFIFALLALFDKWIEFVDKHIKD